MSRENVEVVRAVHEAFNRDDFEAARLLIHPDVELRQPPDLFIGLESLYCGHAGLRQWWDAGKEPWSSFESQIERVVDEGDRVVTAVRFEAVGRESGAKVELPSFANAWKLRNRLVVNFDAYYSFEQALEALGPSA